MVSTATAAQTLDLEAFNDLLMEKRLTPWMVQGYIYAGYLGPRGYELYRAVCKKRYFWSYRQVCTQDNVAGGNLVVTVTAAANTAFTPLGGAITASGNRAAQLSLENADGATIGYYAAVAAVAGATAVFAPVAGAATASSSAQELHNKPVANPNFVEGIVAAAAQTETATFTLYAELIGTTTAPTVSWTGSAGTPNAAAATENTISSVEVFECR